MSIQLSPEVISNYLNKALADGDKMKAKQVLCDNYVNIIFSKSECAETGNSSTITQVVDALIKKKTENPDEMITKGQVDNAKQGKPDLLDHLNTTQVEMQIVAITDIRITVLFFSI